MLDLIDKALNRLGIQEDGLDDRLVTYANLIREENAKYNLTAILDDYGMAEKHFADSLYAVNMIKDGCSVCDVGSGGGLPVIPLALAKKGCSFTAVEATGKKCRFLELVSQNLSIGNLNVHNCRIEDFARGEGREAFDVVTARAVAPLNTLLEYVVPLIKVGGKALVYKGANYEEELAEAKGAIQVLNVKVEQIANYVLENGEKRVIIEFSKISHTEDKYPRSGNRPRLKPIK